MKEKIVGLLHRNKRRLEIVRNPRHKIALHPVDLAQFADHAIEVGNEPGEFVILRELHVVIKLSVSHRPACLDEPIDRTMNGPDREQEDDQSANQRNSQRDHRQMLDLLPRRGRVANLEIDQRFQGFPEPVRLRAETPQVQAPERQNSIRQVALCRSLHHLSNGRLVPKLSLRRCVSAKIHRKIQRLDLGKFGLEDIRQPGQPFAVLPISRRIEFPESLLNLVQEPPLLKSAAGRFVANGREVTLNIHQLPKQGQVVDQHSDQESDHQAGAGGNLGGYSHFFGPPAPSVPASECRTTSGDCGWS